MKKAIVLLHGFKSRNSDDFIEIEEYFQLIKDTKVFNINWFDNYELETQKLSNINNLCKEVAKSVSDFDHIDIIGYSTGALLTKQIESYIPNKSKVNIYLVGPLIKRYFLIRFIGAIKTNLSVNRKISSLKKSTTFNEYKNYIEKNKANKTFDLYIFQNFLMTEKLKMKFRRSLLNDRTIHWLLAKNDFAIRTPEVYKILKRKGHKNVTIEDFNHGQIMKNQKDIFMKWYEGRTK